MGRLHRHCECLETLLALPVLALVVLGLAAFMIAGPVRPAAAADKPVDFMKEVQPVLASSCLKCHGAPDPKDPRKKPAGGLRLDDRATALKGGKSGKAIIPGKSKDSLLYKLLQGPVKSGKREIPAMPKAMGPDAFKPLEADQIEIIKHWIDQGAQWGKEKPIDFAKDVQPIFEESCTRCHGPSDPKDPRKKTSGGLRLDDRTALLRGGKSGKAVIPGKARESLLYKLLQGPVKQGGREIAAMPKSMGREAKPLDAEKIEVIRQWIDQGAK